jgi:tetratricopeptide (TPR) repeat protein
MLTHQHMYAAQKRHAAYYLARLQEIRAHYRRGGDNMPIALQKAKHLWGQIQIGQAWSARNPNFHDSAAICLAYTEESITRFIAVFQPLSERVRWLSDGLAAAREIGNHAEIIRLLIELVEVRIFHGEMMLDTNKALLDEALALARKHCLYAGEAHALLTLGRLQILFPPDDGKARQYMETALEIFRRIDDLPRVAESLRNLGVLEENLQNLEEAKAYQQEALKIYTVLGDEPSLVIVLARLASIAEREGDYATGYMFAKRALTIARRTEDSRAIANALHVIGLLTDLLGDRAASWVYFEEMLNLSRTIDNRRYTMYALVNLGYMASMKGEYHKALSYYREIRAISAQMNDPSRQADALDNIGFLYIELGELDKARQHLHDALAICMEIDAKDLLYTILLHFAYWLAHVRHLEISRQVFHLAVSMPAHNDPLFAEPSTYIINKLRILMPETVLERSRAAHSTAYFQQVIQQLLDLSAPDAD